MFNKIKKIIFNNLNFLFVQSITLCLKISIYLLSYFTNIDNIINDIDLLTNSSYILTFADQFKKIRNSNDLIYRHNNVIISGIGLKDEYYILLFYLFVYFRLLYFSEVQYITDYNNLTTDQQKTIIYDMIKIDIIVLDIIILDCYLCELIRFSCYFDPFNINNLDNTCYLDNFVVIMVYYNDNEL